MEEKREFKMIAHIQRVIYILIVTLFFLLFFMVAAFLSSDKIFFIIVAIIFTGNSFGIMFAIFHRDFATIKMNKDFVSWGKRIIKWEDIERVELKENKIYIGRGVSKRAIFLNSTVRVYDKDGKDIRFAINKRSYDALEALGRDKSSMVGELLDKISV